MKAQDKLTEKSQIPSADADELAVVQAKDLVYITLLPCAANFKDFWPKIFKTKDRDKSIYKDPGPGYYHSYCESIIWMHIIA